MKIRLNKFLSECGVASRRKAEELIKEGRVTVNKKTVTELSFFVDDENDIVAFDGEIIRAEKKIYFILNKPKGYVTTTSDEKGRKVVTDLINCKQKIFPVGRLDFDTTGVLLLTNDGDFANLITHPKNNIPRVYIVTLNKDLDIEDKHRLLNGITLDKRKSKFEAVEQVKKKGFNKLRVTTTEGRNHFVKNMFGALGYFVDKLDRVSFGPFDVKNIPVGAYVKLSYTEIQKFLKKYGN